MNSQFAIRNSQFAQDCRVCEFYVNCNGACEGGEDLAACEIFQMVAPGGIDPVTGDLKAMPLAPLNGQLKIGNGQFVPGSVSPRAAGICEQSLDSPPVEGLSFDTPGAASQVAEECVGGDPAEPLRPKFDDRANRAVERLYALMFEYEDFPVCSHRVA